MPKTEPVHIPFDPDNAPVDDMGWLWWQDEWRLVTFFEDSGGFRIVFVEPCRPAYEFDWQDAERYRGCPYMPASAPTIRPGKCDLLEIRVTMAGGFIATQAIGDPEDAERMQREVLEILTLPRARP